MKKLFILILAIGMFIPAQSQDEDEFQTIGRGKNRISGFGGPLMSFTQIGNDFTHMMGGGGGVIINNVFLGGYGMGKTNELPYRYDPEYVMDFGHGGFWLGYTMFYNKAIHPVIHTTIGWGGISKRPEDWNGDYDYNEDTDVVFVICPTFELEMNFSRYFKLGGGVTYNFVYNTDGPYTFKDFNHPGVFLSFKFGSF